MKLKNASKLGLSLIIAAGINGCNPVPGHKLSKDERVWDMHWMYSIFEQNYAPLEYKQELYKFDMKTLETKYDSLAIASFDLDGADSNDAFYDLMFSYVAEFHDAHTSPSLANSSLPGREKVAYLGFSGFRNGDNLVVKNLMSTYTKAEGFPIKEGDVILKINGKPLKQAITDELIAMRNLGNDEANFTYHMNKLFYRVSTLNGLPKDRAATLLVQRNDKTFSTTLPWVVQDMVDLKAEQQKVEDAKKKKGSSLSSKLKNAFRIADAVNPFRFNFLGFDGRVQNPLEAIQKITRFPVQALDAEVQYKMTDGFRFVDNYSELGLLPELATEDESEDADDPQKKISDTRAIPEHIVPISAGKTYPAYVTPVKLTGKDGAPTGQTLLVGYIYLDTFSPDESDENKVVAEFRATLAEFQSLGVKNIVIDTLNNGGGSLSLGMKLARSLSNDKADVKMPYFQFKKSDTWHDEFQEQSLNGANPTIRDLAKDALLDWDKSDAHSKDRLSKPHSLDILAPFALEANPDLNAKFNVVLLVNEMCASMCDIFAGILQDNKLATLMGTRSMGAGGNVVNHQEAPSSHLDLRQTESLILRSNGAPTGTTALDATVYVNNKGPGELIENKGITPEVEIKVNEYAKDKYQQVLQKAMDLLAGNAVAEAIPVKPPVRHPGFKY